MCAKRLFQIRAKRFRRAQPPHRVAAFVDHPAHQLQNAVQWRLGWRIRRKAVYRDVQLHGRAEEALQQSVMQFLRDARAFGQPLFKQRR